MHFLLWAAKRWRLAMKLDAKRGPEALKRAHLLDAEGAMAKAKLATEYERSLR